MTKRLLMAIMAIFLIVGTASAQSTTRGVTTWTADQNYVNNIQNQLNALAAANALSVSGTFPIVVSAPPHAVVSLSGVTGEQGTGPKVQLSTGATVANDCVKFDANGNTVDNGSACGGGGGSGTGLVNKVINVTDPAYGALGNDTGDDQPAIQAAEAAAKAALLVNLSVPEVYLPAGVYKTLSPITVSGPVGHATINPAFVGAGYSQTYIDAQFVGPALVSSGGLNYPSALNITTTANIIPSGSGTSLTFANFAGGAFNLDEVIGVNAHAGASTPSGPFDALGQWDIRLFIRDDDTASLHCIWASDGGLNNILAPGLPTTGLASNLGAMGYLCVGSDAKLYGSLNVNGTEIRVNSGATTITQGTVYEVELNKDSSHNINLYMGTGGTITRVAQVASGGTTIKQRGDESNYLGGDVANWPQGFGSLTSPWRGALQSVQISSTARHTTATYVQDTAAFTNDANTLFLMNNGLSNFPASAPYVKVDKGMNAGPWFMALSDFSTGCCGGQQQLRDFQITGTATVGVLGMASVQDIERVVANLSTDNSYAGIMILGNATNGSVVRYIPSFPVSTGTLSDVMVMGGISSVENVSLNASAYPLIVQQGNFVNNVFFQTNVRTACAIVEVGGGSYFSLINADAENGGDFPWFCGQSMTIPTTITHSFAANGTAAGVAPLIALYGETGKLTIDRTQLFVPTNATTVVDATYAHNPSGGAQPATATAVVDFYNDTFPALDTPPAGISYTNNGLVYHTRAGRSEFADLEIPAVPQFVQPQAQGGGGASPLTVTLPAVVPGQVMTIAFSVGGFAALPVISSPGWTIGCTVDDHVNSGMAFGTLWKVATPNDSGGSAIFSWSGGASLNQSRVQTFSGLNLLNPVGACHTATTGASTQTSFNLTGGANTDQNSAVMDVVGTQPAQNITGAAPASSLEFFLSSNRGSGYMSSFFYLPRTATEPTVVLTTSPAVKWTALQMELLPNTSQTALMPLNSGNTPTWYGQTAPQFKGVNNAAPQTTLAGTTAGSVVWSMPGVGTSIKAVVANLIAYQNATGVAQTFTYPTPFTTTANVVTDGGSCAGVTSTLTALTLPSSMGGAQSGFCAVVGY